MPDTTAGLPPVEGQPHPGNPQPAGQPKGQEPTPQPEPKPGEPPKQDNPQLAELQQKLAQAEETARKAAESAKYFQSNFDRSQQQLKAAMGIQPQVDPLAEDIKYWSSQGYEEKDARAMAQYMNQKLQPVIQQNQQLQQSLQGTAQVTGVLQAVYEQDPGLFADPTVGQAVQKIALQTALQGQPVDMEYVRQLAINEWANKTQPWKQQTQPTAQPVVQSAPRPPFTGGFIQPGGYQPMPAQATQKPTDPAVEALAQRMAQHAGHKLT